MIRTCNKQVKLDDDRVQARHANVLYNKQHRVPVRITCSAARRGLVDAAKSGD